MLGYSDSNKENGFLAANWSLYRNQKRLAAITDDFDVDMRLFHGRGGSISGGGGPMNDAMLALPNESVSGQIKFTEQGESIAEKYANPDIAERNLEQMLDAQMRARFTALEEPVEEIPEGVGDGDGDGRRGRPPGVPFAPGDRRLRRLLRTGHAHHRHREPQHGLPGRPSRSGDRSVEDLRAIPWVFSWTQARCIIPGWYAVATGIQAYLDDGGEMETLREMYRKWPFFRTKLDNATLALARTDFDIAERYAGPGRRRVARPDILAHRRRVSEHRRPRDDHHGTRGTTRPRVAPREPRTAEPVRRPAQPAPGPSPTAIPPHRVRAADAPADGPGNRRRDEEHRVIVPSFAGETLQIQPVPGGVSC